MSQPIRRTEISDQAWEYAQQLIPGGVNSPVRAFRSVGGIPPFISSAKGSRVLIWMVIATLITLALGDQ